MMVKPCEGSAYTCGDAKSSLCGTVTPGLILKKDNASIVYHLDVNSATREE